MEQLSRDSNAQLFLLSKKAVFTGSLSECIDYWKHRMSALGQQTSYILLDLPNTACRHLEPDQIAKLASSAPVEPSISASMMQPQHSNTDISI
jgi:hypothetical protein